MARSILDSVSKGREDVAKHLMIRVESILHSFYVERRNTEQSLLVKLDKVLDMSKTGALSNTIAFAEGVDLESINKSK